MNSYLLRVYFSPILLKGTVSVISSDPLYKETMHDLQWYLSNHLIRSMEDIFVSRGIKVFISDSSHMFLCSRNAQVTFVEKPTVVN